MSGPARVNPQAEPARSGNRPCPVRMVPCAIEPVKAERPMVLPGRLARDVADLLTEWAREVGVAEAAMVLIGPGRPAYAQIHRRVSGQVPWEDLSLDHVLRALAHDANAPGRDLIGRFAALLRRTEGDSARCVGDLARLLPDLLGVAQALAEGLRDGRLSPSERADLGTKLAELRGIIDHILPDLRA